MELGILFFFFDKKYDIIRKKRNIERKKIVKKNILVMLSILIITILSGCQKKEEVSTYEQDRVAQYILDKVVMILKENKIGDELRFGFYTGEVKFREAKKEKRKIEIIYLKEK